MTSQFASANRSDPAALSIPLAVVVINETGAVNATLDGVAFSPPGDTGHWNRARFGDLLDAISEHRTRTVRVEVHEFDGSVFTDIIHVARKERTPVKAGQPSAMRRARHRPTHELFEITGSGFIPGEDVTVALVMSSAEGSADRKARGLIDLSQLADHRSEIMLIGRVSGAIVSERLPS